MEQRRETRRAAPRKAPALLVALLTVILSVALGHTGSSDPTSSSAGGGIHPVSAAPAEAAVLAAGLPMAGGEPAAVSDPQGHHRAHVQARAAVRPHRTGSGQAHDLALAPPSWGPRPGGTASSSARGTQSPLVDHAPQTYPMRT